MHQGVSRVTVCPCRGWSYLLQQLIVLHVFFGRGAGAFRLFLESFVGGHERGLLGEQSRKTTQQPAPNKQPVSPKLR